MRRVIISAIVVITTAIAITWTTLFSAADAAGPAWVNIDPAGVNNSATNNNFGFNSIIVDPTNPTTVYLGTNEQGLYKSVNSGASWVKINTGNGGNLIDSGAQWTLAIDPFNTQVLYTTAGHGAQGVLKSTNAGVSWVDVFPVALAQQLGTNDIYTISVDPFTPNHLLASFHYYWNGNGNSGIVESKDAGQTWKVYAPAGAWSAGNGVWFGNNSSTWIVGSQNAGFWITTNGGATSGTTWRQFTTTSMTHGATEALYRDPATGTLVVADQTTILRSTDNGTSWQDIGGGLTFSYYETIVSDGLNMWTAPSFPDLGDNGAAHGPWATRSLLGSTNWAAYSSQQTCDTPTGFCNGPVMGAYDSVNHIVYAVNWNGGVWKLQTGSSSTPTPVPPTNTPVATATFTPVATSTSTATPAATATSTPTATLVPTNTPAATSTATTNATASPTQSTCQVMTLEFDQGSGTWQPKQRNRDPSFCTDQ